MLRVIVVLVALLCFVPGPPPADAQQRFTQNPISLQNAAGADGNGSAITTKGYLSVALQVTGTFTATVNFEGTADASTWVALKCVNVATDSRTTTLTAAGMVQCNVQGMSSLRARVSGWSDGTVTVTGYLMDVVLGSTSGGSGGGGAGAVSTLAIASGVTTNTSTTPVAGVSGTKNFQWVVIGTGAVTQTVVLKGSFDSDGSNSTDLCTMALSGTAPVSGVCDPFTAPFPYLFVTTSSTTGTGASGTGRMGY